MTEPTPWRSRLDALLPALILTASMVVAAAALQQGAEVDGARYAAVAAAIAALSGAVIGASRAPDLLAHAWGALAGGAIALTAVAFARPDLGDTLRLRVQALIDEVELWTRATLAGRDARSDLLFAVAVVFLSWLTGYAAAWMLVRREWALPAIVMPGMLIAISLERGGEGVGRYALIDLGLALALLAMHTARQRARVWTRAGLPPVSARWPALALGGAAIALVAVLAGAIGPVRGPDQLVDAVGDRLQRPTELAREAWESALQAVSLGGEGAPTFSQFSGEFDLGGELDLGDDPVALVRSDSPHYLVAYRYDAYDGQGWSSSVERTFIPPDGASGGAPVVTFGAGATVYLSDDVTGARTEVTADITMLRPAGPMFLTIETFSSASRAASMQLGWQQLDDAPYDVASADSATYPVELRPLISLLRQAQFDPATGDAVVPALQSRIDAAVRDLAGRYLTVAWTLDASGYASTLYVTGQAPVYDDIEVVLAQREPQAGDAYSVIGLQSVASPDDLRGAGEEYPAYVTARYLQLPESVTERTRQVAADVTADAATPYDKAVAIEGFLRETYPYEEKIASPPGSRDVVDWFLFDEQQGYCEYFASAMIVLLRAEGIPARMVTGFSPASWDIAEQGYLYRERQAHAWVEVFFPGYGWVPFEPTPGRTGTTEAAATEAAPSPTPSPTPTPVATIAADGTALAQPPAVLPTPTAAAGSTGGTTLAAQARSIGLVLAVFATLVGGVWLLVRVLGRRKTATAGSIYEQAVRISRRFGVSAGPTTTPREWAQRIEARSPDAARPAAWIAEVYSRERYAGWAPDDEDRRSLRGALVMMRRVASRRRWRRKRSG